MSKLPGRLVIDYVRVKAAAGSELASMRHMPKSKGLNHPENAVFTDWGGPLVNRDSTVRRMALNIIDRAKAMSDKLSLSDQTMDQSDFDWMPGTSALQELFGSVETNEILETFKSISNRCTEYMKMQSTLVTASTPCKIFGDIHGQFRDLLLFFRAFGFPSHHGGDIECVSYVFNGDFVDRGAHQLECVGLLLALKVAYPSRVWLLRGNHEFRDQNIHMRDEGYFFHCNKVFPPGPEDVAAAQTAGETMTAAAAAAGQPPPPPPPPEGPFFRMSQETFAWMPLGAVVGGSILVVHGGIGNGSFKLENLAAIPRPIFNSLIDPLVRNLVWSDPEDSDEAMSRGVHCSPRGGGIDQFGMDVTASFCQQNGLSLVVRGHQHVEQGYKVMHGGKLITVFSARNYFNHEKNDGAMLLVATDEYGDLRVRPKMLARRFEEQVALEGGGPLGQQAPSEPLEDVAE